MEKERTRRYATAKDFADDIRHYLTDHPVAARPPSPTYRLAKFIRRYRVATATAAVVTVTLIVATVLTSWQAVRATTEATRAKNAEAALVATNAKLSKALADAQQGEAKVLEGMDSLAGVLVSAKQFAEAERVYRQLQETFDESDPRRLQADYRLATVLARQMMNYQADRFQEAYDLFQRTHEQQVRALGTDSDHARATVREWATLCRSKAWILCAKPDAPLPDREKALQLARFALELDNSLFLGHSTLALALYRNGKNSDALEALRHSLSNEKTRGGGFGFAAVLYWKLGKEQLARDWYLADRDLASDTEEQPARLWLAEVEEVLGIGKTKEAEVLDSAQFAELYTRLIAEYPKAGELYRRRSIHYARSQRWESAAADRFSAAKLPRGDWRDGEAWATFLIATGDSKTLRARVSGPGQAVRHVRLGGHRHGRGLFARARSRCGLRGVGSANAFRLLLGFTPNSSSITFGASSPTGAANTKRHSATFANTHNTNRRRKRFSTRLFAAMAHYKLGDVQ